MTRIVFFLSSLCLLAGFAVLAQTTRSTVRGVIQDAGDRPVADATVSLRNAATDVSRETRTGADGAFTFAAVAPGEYLLSVRHGSNAVYEEKLTVLVNQDIRAEIRMEATAAARVDVTATRGMLKTETASLGVTIENRLVTGLPLDGRNFLELSLLTPGAVPAAEGSAGSTRGDFAFNINGSREDGNNFLLDGVYNGDPKLNTFGVVSAVDSIREFEVATSTYDASFSRNAGAQVNVVTRSGSNEVHGTAYEFFRNGAMDARNYFVPAGEKDPRYQRNQFGFSLGAPVRKNKTFAFGDFEGRRVREGITKATNVPTALERSGDFSQSGIPFLIDLFTQQPFPGSRIPRERMHPIGAGIANLYPLPTRNVRGQNFVSSPVQRDRNDQFDARIDHQLRPASDLSFRYSLTDRNLFDPFAGPSFSSVPGWGNDVLRRSQNVMLAETHAFTPSLLNEFRAAFTRVSQGVLAQGRNGIQNAQLGLPTISRNPRDAGMSLLTVPGYSNIGDDYNAPQQSATNTFQVLDTATLVKGRGILKFGFDFRRLQQNAFRDVQSRGFINFVGFTGNALAELIQGIPAVSGVARLDNPQYLRTSSYNFFVNDQWRATSRLTLTFGARYEYNSPAVDRFNRANLYDSSTGRLAAVGAGALPRAGYSADRNNFAPRVGLAYRLNDKTVLRSGYGVYFDQSALAPGEGLYFSAPYYDFRLFVFDARFPLLLHDPFPANYPIPIPNSATAFQRDLRSPYVQHFNVNVQRSLGGSRVVEVGYVGSKGTKLLSARDLNQPGPSAAQFNPRPNLAFGDVTILESRANSNYHSLQARMQQRLSRGLSLVASYAWAKSIDDASAFFSSTGDGNFPQDSRNARLERARSNFDVRQRFTMAYAYDLPFGKGRLLGGWQTFGVWTFQTGRPFTVALPSADDNSGTGISVLGFGSNDRPHALRDATLSNPTPERWFDTTAFARPARGTFGNAGRNILDGDGLQSVNASLVKNFALRETMSLQFRAEFFNLFNHVNFDLPDLFQGSPAFGRVGSARSPRHVQFGLKFLF